MKRMSGDTKNKEVRPYPFPEPLPSSWPQPGEKVDLLWANHALQFGNPSVFARHLRENEKVDPSLRKVIERMLDPKRQGLRLKFCYHRRGRPRPPSLPSCAADLADLFDPPPGSKIRLKFVPRKGRPRKLDQQARKHAICAKVEEALVVEKKLTRAVEAVAQEIGRNPITVWRALEPIKSEKNENWGEACPGAPQGPQASEEG